MTRAETAPLQPRGQVDTSQTVSGDSDEGQARPLDSTRLLQ